MKIFGSFTELLSLVLRKNSNTVTVQPNTATASVGNVVIELPAKTTGTSTLSDTDTAQTLTNKTIVAGSNTISGLLHGTQVDNPTVAHGATGAVVGTTNSQTLTNKTLLISGSNTIDVVSSGNVVGTTNSQTLTNKTLTSPTITTPIISGGSQSPEISTPSTPPTNSWKEYFKTDGKYIMDDAGVETKLESSVVPDLDDLGDVVITAPSNGQALVYDSGNWVNDSVTPTINYQISSSSNLFTSSSTTPVDVTNLTVTITTIGNPVELFLIPEGTGADTGLIEITEANTDSIGVTIRLDRGGVAIFDQSLAIQCQSGSATTDPLINVPASCVKFLDTPAAGTYTYKIQIDNQTAGQTCSVFNCKLVAREWN